MKAQERIICLNNGQALRINNGIETLDTAFGDGELNFKTYITNSQTGLLQFYSDGTKIWDSRHRMLKSHFILPGCTNVFLTHKDKSDSSYYLVSIASGELYAFTISRVGSEYEVTDSARLAFGVPLYSGSLEMIRACDGNSFWIIVGAPEFDAKIHAFYATKDSIFSRPVTSKLRFKSSVYGLAFKCSPDGKYLAAIYSNGSGMVDVYRFDRKCGSFSFEKAGYFKYYISQHHGMTFSQDSRYLFVSRNHHDVTSTNSVIRFDLNSENLDSSAYRWDLNTGELISKIACVNHSLYVLWFESQRTYWDVWLDKIVDYRDTSSTIIPRHMATGLLHNFPNVQEPEEANCFIDSVINLNIDFRCVDDLITISNFHFASIADSVLLYFGDSLIRFSDSVQAIAKQSGNLSLRLEAYNCGFPSIFERRIFIP
ncbi:MAG: hypothetical protein LPK48_05555, partial [Bacteroidota bacterium]|nr:hypothetical protein [Bacteroidota bacterium]